MAEYHHRGHSVHDCKYHLIRVTKCRFAVLEGDVANFCAPVGAVDEKTIKRYSEEQKWDDDGEGQFRIVTGR